MRKNMENKQKVTLTLDKKIMKFLNSLPRNVVPSKSKLIDNLLTEYSCSMSGSLK